MAQKRKEAERIERLTENRWNAQGYVLKPGAKGWESRRGFVYYAKDEVQRAPVKAARIVAAKKAEEAERRRIARQAAKRRRIAAEARRQKILHADRYLFFDTETTGLLAAGVVSIAAILTDTDGQVMESYYNIVRPRKSIEPGAIEVHGITNEYAMEHGIPLDKAMSDFDRLWQLADVVVAHNISFDHEVINLDRESLGLAPLPQKLSLCTMERSTDFCGIYHPYFGLKWPRLEELYQILFGCGFDDAHNAMSDTEAVRRCFFELRNLGVLD